MEEISEEVDKKKVLVIKASIKKGGNSYVIRIPKALIDSEALDTKKLYKFKVDPLDYYSPVVLRSFIQQSLNDYEEFDSIPYDTSSIYAEQELVNN